MTDEHHGFDMVAEAFAEMDPEPLPQERLESVPAWYQAIILDQAD